MMNKVALGLVLALVITPSFAKNYKWVDEKGQVHYGSNPPAGVKATRMKPPKASSSAQQEIKELKENQKATLETLKKEEQLAQKKEKMLEQRRIFKANCHAAKAKLASLQEKPKVRKTDAYGQLSVMPEMELKTRIKKAESEIEIYCNPPKIQNPE